MRYIVCTVILVYLSGDAVSEISSSKLINKLYLVKPVGLRPDRRYLPLTEIPPPYLPPTLKSLRRQLDADCSEAPGHREVFQGAKLHIFGDYYEEKFYMTVATVIFPDHIDRKHYEVTTSVPYYTLKHTIHGIGYNPTTLKNFQECELLYQAHLEDAYSEESANQSEESMEMAKPPLPDDKEDSIYSNME